jgi:hypothetical protein
MPHALVPQKSDVKAYSTLHPHTEGSLDVGLSPESALATNAAYHSTETAAVVRPAPTEQRTTLSPG